MCCIARVPVIDHLVSAVNHTPCRGNALDAVCRTHKVRVCKVEQLLHWPMPEGGPELGSGHLRNGEALLLRALLCRQCYYRTLFARLHC